MSRLDSTSDSKTTIYSSFIKSVYLPDWWLEKVEGKHALAIGGFASREGQGVRVFSSAAISNRHDTTTLEAIDGITITISGFINRSRTLLNNFPSEVCDHFLLGFPYNWEDYTDEQFGMASNKRLSPTRVSPSDESMFGRGDSFNPNSLENLPVTMMRDLFMSGIGDMEESSVTKSIFDYLIEKVCKHSGESAHASDEISALDEVSKSAEVPKKSRKEKGISSFEDKREDTSRKISCQSKMDSGAISSTRTVGSRRITRSLALGLNRRQEEEDPSHGAAAREGAVNKQSASRMGHTQKEFQVLNEARVRTRARLKC